jgi:diphthine synthase
MLYLIGVGFHPEHLNIEAEKAIKKCKEIFAEDYTLKYDFASLSKMLKRKIRILSREEFESGKTILDSAEKKDTCVLIPGDPLTATTHFSLLQGAKEHKIKFRIIHNISIFSAIAETGLHMYKFGKTTSIPFPQEGFEPTSFIDTIKQNQSIGAHTLILLDIGMSAKQGFEILIKASAKSRGIEVDTMAIAAHISSESRIVYGKISDLMKLKIPVPCSIIIPAELHFSEKDILKEFYSKA